MKKNALVVIGLVAVLALGVIGVSANTVAQFDNTVVTKTSPKVAIDAARKIALKAQPGEITKEIKIEEEGKIVTYIFKITAKNGKKMEVEIDADTGEVLFAGDAVEEEPAS